MADRSSRPHHSPNQTPTRTERIIKVRVLRRWGPAHCVDGYATSYLIDLSLPPRESKC